jgi:hypothetical protein
MFDRVYEILELDDTVLGVFDEKMIYVVFFIDLGFMERPFLYPCVHPVHLFLFIIEERNDPACIDSIPSAESQEEITVFQYRAISLFKPYVHADHIGVESDDLLVCGGFVENYACHAASHNDHD